MRRRNASIGLLVSVVAAGCGGSSRVAPRAWTSSVCGAVLPFEQTFQRRGSALALSADRSIVAVKRELQGFLSATAGDAQRAVEKLKAAGSPDVSNGKKIAATLVIAFTHVRDAFVTAQGRASALPTNSAPAFKTAAQSVLVMIRSSVSGIGRDLGGLRAPVLDRAVKATPACRRLSA